VQVSAAACHQMIAFDVPPPPADFQAVELADADAPAMLALATLTVPGPFFSETHRFGGFIGVKQDGVLVAMAGERMRVPGATEVSGVCTHPAHRGRGHANALIRAVAGRILARGEVPFLHVYATNTPAIALYQSLGFTLNRVVTMTAYRRAG
jgi:predicted GNAT family acetyltransferase